MKKILLLMCVLLCPYSYGNDSLIVIFDSGNTFSLAPYLPEEVKNNMPALIPKSDFTAFQLPITTPSMQPGNVKVQPKSLRYLQRPLFLIGSDDMSREWLIAKREQLIDIGAVGLLIEAQTLEQINEITALAEGLRLVPASAENFAGQLGLSYYPVLLSKEGWEQ